MSLTKNTNQADLPIIIATPKAPLDWPDIRTIINAETSTNHPHIPSSYRIRISKSMSLSLSFGTAKPVRREGASAPVKRCMVDSLGGCNRFFGKILKFFLEPQSGLCVTAPAQQNMALRYDHRPFHDRGVGNQQIWHLLWCFGESFLRVIKCAPCWASTIHQRVPERRDPFRQDLSIQRVCTHIL